MQEVKKEIPFSEVVKAPDRFKGESVIWGGVIIETIPGAEEALVIARQADVDFQKRPTDLDKSAGRFIIRYRGFLDPAIYGKDREVTVAGKIAGKQERPIGDYRYAYPVIDAVDLRLWEKRIETPYHYDPFWGWPYPRHYRPWHPLW